MKSESPWKSVPRRNIVTFLLAVFFVFASLGVVQDVMGMGRQTPAHYVLTVLLSGLFAVCYAAGGIGLKHKFWIAFVPLFCLQFFASGLIATRMPDGPAPSQYDLADVRVLHQRLIFDSTLTIVCVVLGYVGFLIVSISEARRYGRLQGEKALLDSEMAAAREIQRAMVPEELPPTPGYELECVYRPAAQVGGDFFQVIPLRSGSSLVIVGDVSGKGLSAAMIVSMVVGALNTITSFTEDPAAILAELNRRVCGRAQGGFVTCLVVRLDANGQLTAANAGHLPPYRNGAEIAMAGSLPLGVSATASYEQVQISLHGGESLFLLTDGVVEAQNEAQELLGFPRVESLLRDGTTAADLAGAAQHHGQADDITVVSLQSTAAARVVA